MQLHRSLKIPLWLFSVIPLVNVLFLVVVFFALTSRFILQSGLAITLPSSSLTLAPRSGATIIRITPAPVPAIYYEDEPISITELRHRLKSSTNKDHSLIIKADKDSPYALVVQVTDEALQLGFSVVLATGSRPK